MIEIPNQSPLNQMTCSRDSSDADANHPDLVGLAAIAAIGTALSLAITGLEYGTTNNLFHLPILENLGEEPQFAEDAFIQSLRHFSSGLWLLMRGMANQVDPYWILMALGVVSRFVAVAGFLACGCALGIRGRMQATTFVALICGTFLLRGYSFAGGGGLFVNYFTHSELANGVALWALYLIARGRVTAAVAAGGLVFFINAFMGLWVIAALGVATTAMLLTGKLSLKEFAAKTATGAGIVGLMASPILLSILSNPEFGDRTSVDYAVYLMEYWPYHFLFEAIPGREKIALAMVAALGLLALRKLGRAAEWFQVAMIAFIGLYMAGMVAPYITHSPAVLNLHLLRASTMVHLLAALGAVALATTWWHDSDPLRARVLAPVLIVSLCLPNFAAPVLSLSLAIAIAVIAISFRSDGIFRVPEPLISARSVMRRLSLLWLATVILAVISYRTSANARENSWIREWIELADWARSNTPPDALFLVPVIDARKHPVWTAADIGATSNAVFEARAHRRIWVDFKRGAAVMWSPSYYDQWRRRVDEVYALNSHQGRVEYARRNELSYVVEICQPDQGGQPSFSTGRICVYSARPNCPSTDGRNVQRAGRKSCT